MCSLYFLSAVGRWFGDPAAIAQVFKGDVYEHESMHLYFFHVIWQSSATKKRAAFKWVYFRKQRTGCVHSKDWRNMKTQSPLQGVWISKEPGLDLPPVWLCRYLCISLLVCFLLFFFFNSADFIVFIPLRCNVLLCRIEACTLLEKIKRILFVCIHFF